MAGPFLPYRKPEKYTKAEHMADIFTKLNISSALLITDKFLYESGLTDKLQEAAEKCGVKLNIFTDFKPNPTVENCENGKKVYQREKCGCIIAFGACFRR